MADFSPFTTLKRLATGQSAPPEPAMLGRFELRRILGRGAQSVVWLAFDPRLEREVAIKLLKVGQGSDASAIAQWLQEARSVSRLTHPNIVPVFEADVQEIVDASPWRPPDRLRPLVGMKVGPAKRPLTDVDGVALVGDKLLLLDAKAHRMPPSLANERPGAMRSQTMTIEREAAAWKGKVSTIRANPGLLRVDLSGITEIDGLVVLPTVPFVTGGPALDPVVGSLLRACAVSELAVAPYAEPLP